MKRVSVVLPTYNRKDLLGESVSAVLAQSVSPSEVIVVDDGSDDGTPEFLRKEFGGSVTIESLVHSGLPAVARNHGIARSTGDVLAFCDSDDVWLPRKLETQLEYMDRTGSPFSCTDAFVHGSTTRYLDRHNFRYATSGKNLFWGNFVINSSVVLERDFLGGDRFPEKQIFRGYEDYLLWLRLSTRGGIDYLSQPLLHYRIHNESLSSANRRRDAYVQMRIIFSTPAIVRHPLIGAAKTLKYVLTILSEAMRKQR